MVMPKAEWRLLTVTSSATMLVSYRASAVPDILGREGGTTLTGVMIGVRVKHA